jgi:sec-independent protein translocase protein TatA
MGSFSIWHWLIVLAVVLVLFGGRGRVSQIMGDFGKGLKAFKKSMREDEEPTADSEEAERGARRPMTALPSEHGVVGAQVGDGIGDPLKDRQDRPNEQREQAPGP